MHTVGERDRTRTGCSSSSTGRQTEDRYSERSSSPTRCINGREGWYVAAWDPRRASCATSGWTGSSARRSLDEPSSRARGSTRSPTSAAGRAPAGSAARASRGCWIRAEQARWVARAADRPGRARRTARSSSRSRSRALDFLVREVLKEAGDAVVLEPADAREAVLVAAEGLIARATGEPPRARSRCRRTEVLAFLDEQRTLTCATIGRDGWPHLMPLWYVVRDGECWAWTYAQVPEGAQPERDPRCTLQVEAGTRTRVARRDDQVRVRDPPRPGGRRGCGNGASARATAAAPTR